MAMRVLRPRAFARAVAPQPQPRGAARRPVCRAKYVEEDDELESAVAEFLAQQDQTERGVEGPANPAKVVGAAEVDEEAAKAYCRDIVTVLRQLKEGRDMDFNEVKLIVQVDDPRNDDIRKMGMEDSSGVSRDEMAAALTAVAEGQLPRDRLALKVLHREITNWPFLNSASSPEKPKKIQGDSLSGLLEANAVASGGGWTLEGGR